MPTFRKGELGELPVHVEHRAHRGMLPMFVERAALRAKQERLVADLVLETGEAAPNPTVGRASSGEEKARGVPIMGYTGGAILGTRPDVAAERKLDGLLRRAA